MHKLAAVFFCLIFTACSTNQYIGQSSSEYERLSCTLEENPCEISISKNGYLFYAIEEIGPNRYKVSGEVNVKTQVLGTNVGVSFFLLFMDEELVEFERKIKRATTNSTFDFEVQTTKPITKTSIDKLRVHYRS